MPLVRVSLLKGRTKEDKQALAQQLYEAMRETIGIPENDKFILLDEREEDTFFVDRTFMDVQRSDQVLMIEITLRHGRSVEVKQQLYATIAARLHSAIGQRKEDVFVTLRENESVDWSFGNGVAQYVIS